MLNKCFASDNWIANQIFLLREQGYAGFNPVIPTSNVTNFEFKNDFQAYGVFSYCGMIFTIFSLGLIL